MLKALNSFRFSNTDVSKEPRLTRFAPQSQDETRSPKYTRIKHKPVAPPRQPPVSHGSHLNDDTVSIDASNTASHAEKSIDETAQLYAITDVPVSILHRALPDRFSKSTKK